MLTSIVTVFCTLFAISTACCTPKQWQGYQGALFGYSGFFKRGLVEQSKFISYDYLNKRSAVYTGYVRGTTEGKYKVVTRFSEKCEECGTLYVIDLKRKTCWKKTLKHGFRKFCLPEKAKDLGNYFLGLEGGFKVKGYYFGKESAGYNNWLTVEDVAEGTCAPVTEQVTGRIGHVTFLDTVTFADITPGIKNESVFDVPSQCDGEMDMSVAEELISDKYLFAF